jgi:hypothetical protein
LEQNASDADENLPLVCLLIIVLEERSMERSVRRCYRTVKGVIFGGFRKWRIAAVSSRQHALD